MTATLARPFALVFVVLLVVGLIASVPDVTCSAPSAPGTALPAGVERPAAAGFPSPPAAATDDPDHRECTP